MKKLLSFALLLFVTFSFAFAQEANSLYRFKTEHDAEKLLKVLNAELKLSDTQFNEVKDLLFKTVKSQANFFNNENSKNEESVKLVMTRHTGHIEGNLKRILGDAKYSEFEASKASIAAKVESMK